MRGDEKEGRKEDEPAAPSRPIALGLACRRGRESSDEECDDKELHLGYSMGSEEEYRGSGLRS